MLYNIGSVLVCKNAVNAQCLEMTNPDFDIKCGYQYKVTDKDDFQTTIIVIGMNSHRKKIKVLC